jgi:hypothetical protein
MHTRRLLLALLAGASLLSVSLSAQSFYGSDDFNDNSFASGRWTPFATTNGGLWTETNGRLEFTANASSTSIITSNRAQQFRVWSNTNSGNSSYTDSWSATVSATMDNAVVASNGVQIIGLESFMAGTQSGYYGIYLMYTTSGGRAFSEQGLYNGTNYARTNLGTTGTLTPGFDTSDVLLRLSYNGTTSTFTSGYSVDGGATFLDYGTGAPGSTSGWFVTPTTGFGLEIYGTIYGNGSSAGPIATSGQMYVDNFSVTAIPEPSTYAALAGLGALGLVCWRRSARRQA